MLESRVGIYIRSSVGLGNALIAAWFCIGLRGKGGGGKANRYSIDVYSP